LKKFNENVFEELFNLIKVFEQNHLRKVLKAILAMS